MSRRVKESQYSPLDSPLERETTVAHQESPPAMISLGSGLQRAASNANDGGYSMTDMFDHVTFSFRAVPAQGTSGQVGVGRGRGQTARDTNQSNAVGGLGRSVDRSEFDLRRHPDPFFSRSQAGLSGIGNEYGLYGDMNDAPIHYGGASTTRPSSLAPTLSRQDSLNHESASLSSDGAYTSYLGDYSLAASTSTRPGLASIGVPQAIAQGSGRRPQPQPPPTPKGAAASASPRRSSGGALTSAGKGGLQPDSILVSNSQIAGGAVSPSREAGNKRSPRRIGYGEDGLPIGGSFGKPGPGSGSLGATSPSASGHRKKTSVSIEEKPVSHRSLDSTASSVETSLPRPKNARSLYVNLAHKAVIGKGSYGMVFQAMDRDTNRIIAVKEIALGNGTGSSRSLTATNNTADSGKRSVNHDDTVMGSASGVSSTPASHGKGGTASNNNSHRSNYAASSAAGSGRSPTKANQTTEFQKRLDAVRKELAVLKQLDHPNIVKCLGEEVDDGYLRIYMEYVAGGSVTSVLRKFGNLQERQASNYTRQMLEGLAYLHSKGIIHRDLKGDNLLVDTNGTLKLGDFGTARDMHVPTHTNAIAGTAYFMAPEVIVSEGSDTKSDIWSVGCCVIEMLTGKPPLPHLTNQYSIMLFIAESKGELVDKYIPEGNDWSADVLDFLRTCLARDPAKRPTAQQLLRHRWITSPPKDNNSRSPMTTVLTTRAVANLPSPPPLDRLYPGAGYDSGSNLNYDGTEGSPADTELRSVSPTSERGRKHKKEKKTKREKEKDSKKKSSHGSGNSLGKHHRKGLDPSALGPALSEYNLNDDLFRPNGRGSGHGNDGSASPLPANGLTSPRWGGGRDNKRLTQQSSLRGASFETDTLPDIRAHSSTTTSSRSPFLPSLSGDKTPSSTHAVNKSTSSSQRGVFTLIGSSRRGKNGLIPPLPGPRSSGGYDAISDRGSGHLTKSASGGSKAAETPVKGFRRDQSGDDVLLGKDDSLRLASGNALANGITMASPPQSLRKQKATASPRMPPLPSPTAKKK